jgi:serine/threonine protein phosphatase PrpC
MEIRYAYLTDKGVRQINQDFVRVVSEAENAAGYDVEHCGALFAVADGVGGHQEVFAEINRAAFRKSVSANEFLEMGTTLTALVIHVKPAGRSAR